LSRLGVRQLKLAGADITLNPALKLFSSADKDELNETYTARDDQSVYKAMSTLATNLTATVADFGDSRRIR